MDENNIRRIVQDELRKAPRPALNLPLNIDTIFALKNGGFLTFGIATLASGTVTVLDHRIRSVSTPHLTYKTHSSQGVLRAVCTDGTLTIASTSGTDASEVHYLIIF